MHFQANGDNVFHPASDSSHNNDKGHKVYGKVRRSQTAAATIPRELLLLQRIIECAAHVEFLDLLDQVPIVQRIQDLFIL